MLRPLEYGQIAPLGFMWLERAAVQVFGDGERALRLVPALAGLLSLPLFHRAAFRILAPGEALLAVALLAASYYPARHGVELKPYGIDFLFALLFLNLALPLADPPESESPGRARRPRWAALLALAALGPWLSYPSVFVGAGVALGLALRAARTRSHEFRLWTGAYAVCLAFSFGGMVWLYAGPHSAAAVWQLEEHHLSSAFPPLARPWEWPLWLLRMHAGRMSAYPNGGANGGSATTLVLLVVGASGLARRNRGALLLLLAPFAFTLLAAALHRYPYGGSARVAQHLAPAICLLAGAGLARLLARLPGRGPRLATRVVCLLFGLAALHGAYRDVSRPYKDRSDAANVEAVLDLAARTHPGDRWVLFNALEAGREGPDHHPWGGSAARFRYYVEREAPVPVSWSPRAADIDACDGTTWVLAYRDNESPFPEAAWDAYVQALAARLGPARAVPFPAGELGPAKRDEPGRRERIELLAIDGR